MGGSVKHLSLFRNRLNKLNNEGTRMLEFVYQMTNKLLQNRVLA